jgi:hypothetical protein
MNVGMRNFDRVIRVYVDDYDNPLWEEFLLEAVPTVIFFENGKVVRRLDAGLGLGLDEKEFGKWLEKI